MLTTAHIKTNSVFAHSLCLLALFVSATPFPLISSFPMPSWPLILIFYYSIVKPSVFSPISLSMYGLIYDALHQAPMGTHALFFPLLYIVLSSYPSRLKGRRLNDLWQHFMTTLVIYGAFLWLIFTIIGTPSLSPLQLANHLVLSAIAYPCIHRVLTPTRPKRGARS